jgi:hypothetical protein
MINSTGRTFGAFAGLTRQTTDAPAREERPQAQTWLNIGYVAGEGEDAKFVSLPVGIPLDTQKALDIPRSPEFAMFRAAQNDLLAQLQAAAAELQPGQDVIIGVDGGLAIQLRKVAGPAETPPVDGTNPYARDLGFKRS